MVGGMCQLLRHCSARAHVAEDDHGSDRAPLAVVNRRHRILDRDLGAVPPKQDAVFRDVRRGVALDRKNGEIRGGLPTRSVHDSYDIRHRLPGCFAKQPAGHLLGGKVQERDVARDVAAGHGVADAVERHLGSLPFGEQRISSINLRSTA